MFCGQAAMTDRATVMTECSTRKRVLVTGGAGFIGEPGRAEC
jgi:FlaA1/EpsC-like NDP-sugar epimerase